VIGRTLLHYGILHALGSGGMFSTLRDTLGPPRVTRDGRRAFFSRRITESDVWLVNLQ
jgi:hypothetical protein